MFPTSAVFRAGLAAFTKIFADTYAADNVRMNNVLPGWIDSLPATEERRRKRADEALWHEPRRSPRPSPSSPPRARPTSPARTSASTAASRDRCEKGGVLQRRPGDDQQPAALELLHQSEASVRHSSRQRNIDRYQWHEWYSWAGSNRRPSEPQSDALTN